MRVLFEVQHSAQEDSAILHILLAGMRSVVLTLTIVILYFDT